jgi:hypothetical protein
MNEAFDSKENFFSNGENETPDTEEKEFSIPHKIELKDPVDMGSKVYDSLTFKKPLSLKMVSHLPCANINNLKLGHFIPMIGGMTGEMNAVIERLSFSDTLKCIEVVNYFLSGGSEDTKIGEEKLD